MPIFPPTALAMGSSPISVPGSAGAASEPRVPGRFWGRLRDRFREGSGAGSRRGFREGSGQGFKEFRASSGRVPRDRFLFPEQGSGEGFGAGQGPCGASSDQGGSGSGAGSGQGSKQVTGGFRGGSRQERTENDLVGDRVPGRFLW